MRFDNEELGEHSNMVLQTEYLCLPQIHALKSRISFDVTVFGGGGLWKVIRFRWAALAAHLVKNQLVRQETQVQSLGGEDSLEKKWQPTPVFLPGKSHGQRRLVGYSPWGCKESDMT